MANGRGEGAPGARRQHLIRSSYDTASASARRAPTRHVMTPLTWSRLALHQQPLAAPGRVHQDPHHHAWVASARRPRAAAAYP